MTLERSKSGGTLRQSVIMPSKGLINNPGENNCFMNCAVQVLWHLDVFRRSYRLLTGHTCVEESCIFCALKEIFGQFQESDEAALPPDVLRIAMAKAFQDQRKFQIGRMGDAAECFENILRRLHYHIAYGQNEDSCISKHCITHQKFAMQINEQTFCRCGAISQPFNFFQIVNYVVASTLVDEARRSTKNGYRPHHSFGELLKVTSSFGEIRTCPKEDNCIYKEKSIVPTKIRRTLLNCPDIVGICITWDTDRPTPEYVMAVLDCLGKRLHIKDLFDTAVDEKAKRMKLRLVGIMTYYGKHYTTFVYNSKQETWFYLDDANVQKIGKDWDSVKDRCIRGRHQPLLVFYANQEGEPVKATKAPQDTKVVSKEEFLRARYKNETARGKEAGRAKSQKHKGSKKEKETEEVERDGPVKRKSIKKMFGEALKRRKSMKNTSAKARQARYSGDHVLAVNGQEIRQGKESLNQSLDEQLIRENRYVAEDGPRQKRSSGKKTQESKLSNVMLGNDANSNGRTSSSPVKSPKNVAKMNGEVPQSQRLREHQQHVKSIESKLDSVGDASDYDNFERPKSKTDKHGMKVSPKMAQSERDNEVSPTGNGRYPFESAVDVGIQKLHQQPRRFIAQGDVYADTVDEAESLVVSSIAAEQEGNLVESFHLCNQANMRYKNAFGLQGITDKMRDYADKRFVETQNRSRLLNSKINSFRERASKSADFYREVSKTSDYGSLSDTSGSPMAPADYSVFNQKYSKENQGTNQANQLAEQGGIQAKLNKERSKQDSSKQKHANPTKSLFFTLPRKKKESHPKVSSPQQPMESGMEQLTDAMRNFDHGSQGVRRRSLDIERRSTPAHRSVPDLGFSNNKQQEGDSSLNMSRRGENRPSHIEPKHNGRDFVIANSDAISSGRNLSDTNAVDDSSAVNRVLDRPLSRTDVYSENKISSLPAAADDQLGHKRRKSDGVIVNRSRSHERLLEIDQNTRSGIDNGAELKPKEDLHKTRVYVHDSGILDARNKSAVAGNREIDRGRKEEEQADENHQCTETRTLTKDASLNVQEAQLKGHTTEVSKPPQSYVDIPQNNYKNSSLRSELDSTPMPTQSLSPKHSEKKRSIFKVVIPKILNIDNIVSSRKSKKSLESREKEYAAMLNANAHTPASMHGEEAPETTCSEKSPKASPVSYTTAKELLYQVDSRHEESYVVDPDVARGEVAMVAKDITEKRLFNDSDFLEISPQPAVQGMRSDMRYNYRYNERIANGDKSEQSNSNEFIDVDKDKTELCEERDRQTPSPQKATVRIITSSSISERLSMDRNKNEMNNKILNSSTPSTASNPVVATSVGKTQDGWQSSKVTDNKSDSFSKSPSSFIENTQIAKPVEPPPRKNPNVYRSSELYRPKTETWKSSVTRSYPLGQEDEAERTQPTSPQYHGNTLSRWTNAVDFSKSNRQMCQQCGTVTVEKPRKFCRKCQSDFL